MKKLNAWNLFITICCLTIHSTWSLIPSLNSSEITKSETDESCPQCMNLAEVSETNSVAYFYLPFLWCDRHVVHIKNLREKGVVEF
jgi:hypothetical protein